MRVSMWPGIALLVSGTVCAWLAWPASAQAQSSCSPSSPAAISGSTGAQGVLDPTNTNASLGLVWPAGAVFAAIDIDTGDVLYFDSSSAQIGSAVLPGVSGFPAFPEGKLNFTSVHLSQGTSVFFFSTSLGLPPPLIILSCQDVILDSISILGIGGLNGGQPTLSGTSTLIQLPANFLGGNGPSLLPVAAAGFGPRTGSLPSPGSLYPPIGGGGGNGGANLAGGEGGEAIVIAAAQRITVNGLISANGSNPLASATAAQGGAGGSVRLAAVLVEGDGIIDTSGGADSDGVVRSPAGPIEIQAFLQDLFNGTTSTTPTRGNPVAAPVPDNLPTIQVVGVNVATSDFCGFECSNTGSLSAPDVILPEASSPVAVTVEVFTQDVPLGTSLTFRAVGTDGSAVTAVASVQACDCLEGEGFATESWTLNPGATYQIVVYPSTAFALANLDTHPVLMRAKPVYAGLQIGPNKQESEVRNQKLEVRSQTKVAEKPAAEKPAGTRDLSPLEKWARAFGVDPEAHKKMAQLGTAP